MAVEFVPVDRDTPHLFPPSVQEYLPENHLARFVVEIVEQLDLISIANTLYRERVQAVLTIDAGVPDIPWLRHGSVLQPKAGAGDL